MLKLFGFFLLCSLSLAENFKGFKGIVLQLEDAPIEDYPYHASLSRSGAFVCSGTIVSMKHIATAAHCVKGLKPGDLSIRVGSNFYGKDGFEYGVKSINIHPEYKDMTYDLAVVELDEELLAGDKIDMINLVSNEPEGGEEVIATGWFGHSESKTLQLVKKEIIDFDECNKVYFNTLTEQMICAAVEDSICDVASGGPIVLNGHLAGIDSLGVGCVYPEHPNIYTNVAEMAGFIEGIINPK